MKTTPETRMKLAHAVTEAACQTATDLKGSFLPNDRKYLEDTLTVRVNRMPKWLSPSQIAWNLTKNAAAEVKTHFVLDSDNISEHALFMGTWDRYEALHS